MAQHTGSIGIDTVTLVAIFVEAVLYGFLFVLSIASAVVLVRQSRLSKNPINKPMIVALVSMFILGTVVSVAALTHIAADLQRLLDAFVRHSTDQPGGSKGYLSRLNTPMYVLKSSAYGIQTIVGDAFITSSSLEWRQTDYYSPFYLLHRKYRYPEPMAYKIVHYIHLVVQLGVGIAAVHGFALAAPDHPMFLNDLQHWAIAFFTLTLFINIISTTLIAFRIWWIHRKTKTIVSGRSVLPAMVVIVESGAIYSACLIILLSLYLSGSFTQYIVPDAGIVFSLVILRVALGISSETRKTRTERMTTLVFGGVQSEAVSTEE
ncbi:hypothetical protein CVT25_001848 [Psilocybe cyanescens]|uniref:Uncharacterized protein n=1 Tax=Psilocybe cyanescens TaxID=93625 RepID=A0A409WQD4_PSICY|nr:hypothetical protein CVT25_001848 [Psilocybe cyanescens]